MLDLVGNQNVGFLMTWLIFCFCGIEFVCIDFIKCTCDPVHDAETEHCLCYLLVAAVFLASLIFQKRFLNAVSNINKRLIHYSHPALGHIYM